ncbi:DUF6985 domain-containing protein [Halopseudomonas pachastrellae]|uniref:DUF6985 domain-containing protein n=1 Tax=Halopseudomonas pachastrellae TaxID=254161 RepID=UPI003D7C7BA2
MKVTDEIFGELEYKYVWGRDFQVSLFGKDSTVRLSVGASKEVPCSLLQKSTFIDLSKNIENINSDVMSALFFFYKENLEEFRGCIDSDDWGEMAPEISSEQELNKLVVLENINIQDAEDKSKRVVYYFSTTFEEELGVSVIIVNGKVVEVVTDIAY